MALQTMRETENGAVKTPASKTNGELYVEKLLQYSPEEMAHNLHYRNKCRMCSNFYWDANQNGCHRNTNENNCEKGQQEYFESYPGENLAAKYGKKYIVCHDSAHAEQMKELMIALYRNNLVDVPELSRCHKCKADCLKNSCGQAFRNIIDMYDKWLKTELDKIEEEDRKKEFRKQNLFQDYLSIKILSKIPDIEKRSRMMDILHHCYED